MFVDFLQWGVFECIVDAPLGLSVVDFVENGSVLDDLDAGELFQDPALCRVVCELSLVRLERLVHRCHAPELFGIGAGVERDPFNQRQDRGGAVR